MDDFFYHYFPNVIDMKMEILQSTFDTLYMTFFSGLVGGFFGIVLALLLVATQPNGVLAQPKIYAALDKLINLFRAIPFVILLSLLTPFTRQIVGKTIGLDAALVPLIIGFAPFFARQIQNALLEVDEGIIEAAKAMGSSPYEIFVHVYLKEGLPAIIRASAVSIISLIGLTTMAGAVGAGGLGTLAVKKGHEGFKDDISIVCTLIILVLVFFTQWVCNVLIKKVSH
ncbi:methionine ABC transporter permease [Frischella perrara]|jgi:ABC-type metal ion transport system, permease component|uniref:ABC-type metal ion transport system, permease component n=1 Tax=Frischella perrara TaxID=1267021 RepID=A0A0A7S759_FRIPE|nr:methionine ABC transporter permease [Frischella perrara]AJA45091.1 ABC-type metal ion transport system, permease component [Frischella perrara]MCT6875358.1 ABC transporter permease [Frischella perrara]PWV66112.1 D-methionine transport system permease protein [Frischella perrara]